MSCLPRSNVKTRHLVVLLLVACGCASAPKVRVDSDPYAELSSYTTFAFFERPATDRAQYSSIVTARLQRATRAQLEQLGYVYDEHDPQLRVNFFLNIAERQQLRATPVAGGGFYRYRLGYYGAWGGYPYNVDSVEYKAGTLSVDVVDSKRRALVWQGVAEGRVHEDALRNPGPAIDAVIAEVFRSFPHTAGS